MSNMKAPSLTGYGKKVMCKVGSFPNVDQRSRSRSRDQNLWYHQKGLVIRNTHVKYESPISYGKKVMCKVGSFPNVG